LAWFLFLNILVVWQAVAVFSIHGQINIYISFG
jgi:hypothetical protein